MKFILSIVALCVGVCSAQPKTINAGVMQAFENFQAKYDKKYSDQEWGKRMGIFAQNLARVNTQNQEHILEGGDAVFGVTKFMDLTPEEFKATYLTYIPRNESTIKRVNIEVDGPLAAEVDWRTKNAVTPVKDQGQCGSCWAFSATEAIESYAFLAGQKLQELSPQQINSCDTVDQGCNGGNTETAYEYVIKAGGIEGGDEYPYTSGGGTTGVCKFKAANVKVKITGYTSVTKGETSLKAALNNGPVSICVAADSFQTYNSGILKRCPGQIDHCVQAVGYDTAENYWIVRNSWGTSWGEKGFIRIEMGKDLCKIANDVTFPKFS
jgi:C1A family cysteine protease